MLTADQEWESFLLNNELDNTNIENITIKKIPKVTDLYISTQTKICFLNQPVNLEEILEYVKKI